MHPEISLLPAARIDREKWDACIRENSHGLLYATTAYLDAMCDNWTGLVVKDYTHVMAIPWKKKWGIRYGYTPPFIQQLGITGDGDTVSWEAIWQAIKGYLKYADLQLNFTNAVAGNFVPLVPKTNLVLDLSRGYDLIQSHYRNDLKENIRKADPPVYCVADPQEAIVLYQQQYQSRLKKVQPADYLHFSQLCQNLQASSQCFARAAKDREGALLAIALFLRDDRRVYNLMNTTLPEGRHRKANHFLLHRVIHEFAGEACVFDFEGSDLPGVQHFYEGFGATNQPYFFYRHNQLPWPLRLLRS